MEGIVIKEFNGDAQALERMARLAWRDEYGLDSYPNLYKPAYLDYLMSGVFDPGLAIAAYRGEDILGFLLNLPRKMVLDGRTYKAALTCLLVVRKEAFRKGLAQAMIQEGLKRNEKFGFDFTLFYLETGHRSSKLFKKLAAAGYPIERVKRMHVIARVLDFEAIKQSENIKAWETAAMKAFMAHKPPKGPPDPRVREASADDAEKAAVILNSISQKVRLARIFEPDEVRRELISPPLARTLLFEKDGEIKGVLAYATVEHVGRTTVPWAWINHVAWDGLSTGERVSLVRTFLLQAREQGCAGAVEWSKHVYPAAALYLSRFVPYPRQVDMMAWRFRDDISLSGIRRVYEVQI